MLFGGYPWHRYTPYVSLMDTVPPILRILGRKGLERAGVGDITGKWYRPGRIALFPCQNTLEKMLLYPTSAMSEQTVKWLLRDGANGIHNIDPTVPHRVHDSYNRMLAMDCLNLLPEKFLMKADKGTMAWGIEERLPLLDQRVIEFAFLMDPAWKKDKRVLRKAVRGLLPPAIVGRKKQGFGTPIGEWLRSKSMRGMVREQLLGGELLKEVCREGVLSKVASMVAGGSDSRSGGKEAALSPTGVVWGLFAMQVWHDVWFGGKR